MRAAAQTKIFGMRIPVDPKILFGALAAMIGLLWWYNSRGDEETNVPAGATRSEVIAPIAAAPVRSRTPVSRRAVAMSDRGTLRLRPIDATKGDIDPTLRLDLLARLQSLRPVASGRSLFESGGLVASGGVTIVPMHPPMLRPGPLPTPGMLGGSPMAGGALAVSIPLRYYGYVKPSETVTDPKSTTNRGFFLDGDNVLVASEGEVLKLRYLVVELTPTSARVEDTQLRQGQTLPVTPAAMP